MPRVSAADGEPRRAIIGDPRNDENVIVSQLQSAMIRFHNRMANLMKFSKFEDVQRQVRWHYQWVVLYDFLPTIIGEETFKQIMGEIRPGSTPTANPPQLQYYKIEDEAYMPLEFSVAAYRFGHSMVRPVYRLSATVPDENSDRISIFVPDGSGQRSLVGFGEFPEQWAIDWGLFFDTGDATPLGPKRVQPSYKIDTSLVEPLGSLPKSVVPDEIRSLALRNLLRSWRMQLPSGQAVARAMGLEPIKDEDLKVGKAIEGAANPSITESGKVFEGNAPLWFYILAEAQQQFKTNDTPIRLGPVGGRIVGEVFVGLLLADSHSFLRQCRGFRPHEDLARDGEFKMADLLRSIRGHE